MPTITPIGGFVSRSLPPADPESRDPSPQINLDSSVTEMFRQNIYNEMYVEPKVRKTHSLVDEGTYYIASGGNQTGILSSAATGFVATTPAMVIANTDTYLSADPATPANPNKGQMPTRRVYIDYINLVTTVVGSAASGLVNLQAALYLDTGNRYSSGGTNLTTTTVSPNSDYLPRIAQAANVFFGAITATAATSQVRPLVPLRVIRPAVSGTVLDVVGETKWFNFGGVEGSLNGSITIANANFITVPMPGIVLGPNTCALLYLWQNLGGTNVAATYAVEVGFWER